MIWSDSRKLCFIHIPKTGGTSITESYETRMLFGDVLLGGVPFAEGLQKIYRERYGIHKHSGVRQIVKLVGMERFEQQYSFAMVRDPIDRMISFYQWLRRPDIFAHLDDELRPLSQADGIASFVEMARPSFYTQSQYVTNLDGEVIVSELFPVDRMDYAVESISKKIGVELKTRHGNKSEKLDFDMSAEALEMINEFYASDVTLYRDSKLICEAALSSV